VIVAVWRVHRPPMETSWSQAVDCGMKLLPRRPTLRSRNQNRKWELDVQGDRLPCLLPAPGAALLPCFGFRADSSVEFNDCAGRNFFPVAVMQGTHHCKKHEPRHLSVSAFQLLPDIDEISGHQVLMHLNADSIEPLRSRRGNVPELLDGSIG
jgi:hypothetical protein